MDPESWCRTALVSRICDCVQIREYSYWQNCFGLRADPVCLDSGGSCRILTIWRILCSGCHMIHLDLPFEHWNSCIFDISFDSQTRDNCLPWQFPPLLNCCLKNSFRWVRTHWRSKRGRSEWFRRSTGWICQSRCASGTKWARTLLNLRVHPTNFETIWQWCFCVPMQTPCLL